MCFSCEKTKEMECFYKHPGMADGRLGKCKECAKHDSRKNRKENINFYREYDRKRGGRQSEEYAKKWKEKNKQKAKAHGMVKYAIRKGELTKKPCENCGRTSDIHAHHDDYLLPLNVRWLCPVHHKEWHLLNGEGKNGQ